MSFYVYALLGEAPAECLGTGIAGEPLRVLSLGKGGEVFAAVGEVDGAPAPAAAALRAHDETVRRLTRVARAVLPARFGSVVAAPEDLTDLVARRAPSVQAALLQVYGCEQMTLRVYALARPADIEARRPADAGGLALAAGGPGTRYLAERIRLREASRHLPEIEPVRRAVAAMVRGERCERHLAPAAPAASGPVLVASVYHLLPRGESAPYDAAVRAAAAALPVTVTASGPWPPYAFAAEALA